MSIAEAAKLADKPVEEQRAAISKPKEKKAKAIPLGAYEELLKQHEELEDDYESLAAELEMAQKELTAVEAIRRSEHMPMIMHLHQQIRSMTEARDQWQTKCNEMTKQLNFLTKNK
jgi:chromosome segregation ATPase